MKYKMKWDKTQSGYPGEKTMVDQKRTEFEKAMDDFFIKLIDIDFHNRIILPIFPCTFIEFNEWMKDENNVD